MKARKKVKKLFKKNRPQLLIVVIIFAIIGVIALTLVRAAPDTVGIEAESGQPSGNAKVISDAAASGGQYISFQGASIPGDDLIIKGMRIPKKGTLLGAFSDPNAGISVTIPTIESNIGRKLDMRMRFYTTAALTGQLNNIKNDIANSTRVEIISWEPSQGAPSDDTIRNVANALKSNKPVMVRYAHEMNGNWYAWSVPHNTTENYKTNWRRVYNIFKTTAPNVLFNWAAFGYNIGRPYTEYYPGDEYVDIIGIDLYVEQAGKNMNDVAAGSVLNGLYNTYKDKKPIMVMETNSGPRKPNGYYSNKTNYYNNMVSFLQRYPKISGVVFFDENKWAHPEGVDMSIADTYNGGDNTANMNAFKNMAKNCHWGTSIRQAECRGQ